MTPQQLLIISNLISMLSPIAAEAVKALLNRGGYDPDKLLDMAAQNNATAMTMLDAEIKRVSATVVPVNPAFIAPAVELPASASSPKKK